MSPADLRKIGSIDLLDLDIISRFSGRDFLPYPFMFTQPSRFSWHDEYAEYARSVPDRFNNGDLRMFQECAGSYANADIRVECHVQYIPADTPSVRVVAARRDQAGFLAKQRPYEGFIDVYELSPYLLGPAVAESVALEKPGRRSAISFPSTRLSPTMRGLPKTSPFTTRLRAHPAPPRCRAPRWQRSVRCKPTGVQPGAGDSTRARTPPCG
jgi:EspG family